jgi:hypothetical protein
VETDRGGSGGVLEHVGQQFPEHLHLERIEVIVLGLVSKSGNTFVTDAKVLDVGSKKLLGTANSRGDSPDSIFKTRLMSSAARSPRVSASRSAKYRAPKCRFRM